jgi:hypothetical protein
MRHAGRDALNIGNVLLAEPHRVGLAGLALLLTPLLRGLLRLLRRSGQGRKRQRKAKDRRSACHRSQQRSCDANFHYQPSSWRLSRYF